MDKTLALMIIDIVVSLATYFITKYVSPATAQDVLYIIGGMQPIVIYVIKTWKDKEVALLDQGINPKTMKELR